MDPERGDRWIVPRKEACLVSRIPQLGWLREHATWVVAQSPVIGLILVISLRFLMYFEQRSLHFILPWAQQTT